MTSSPVSMQDNAEGVAKNPLIFTYRNWRGEIGERRVMNSGTRFWYGTTRHHPDAQTFLSAFDLDKKDWRDFATKDILRFGSSSPVPSVDVGGDGNRLPRCVAGAAAAVWQPIRTAPMDETLVWLFEPHAAGGFMFAGLFDVKRQAWINNLDQQAQKPTHWMFLPDEPALIAEDAGRSDDGLTFTVSIDREPGEMYKAAFAKAEARVEEIRAADRFERFLNELLTEPEPVAWRWRTRLGHFVAHAGADEPYVHVDLRDTMEPLYSAETLAAERTKAEEALRARIVAKIRDVATRFERRSASQNNHRALADALESGHLFGERYSFAAEGKTNG